MGVAMTIQQGSNYYLRLLSVVLGCTIKKLSMWVHCLLATQGAEPPPQHSG